MLFMGGLRKAWNQGSGSTENSYFPLGPGVFKGCGGGLRPGGFHACPQGLSRRFPLDFLLLVFSGIFFEVRLMTLTVPMLALGWVRV